MAICDEELSLFDLSDNSTVAFLDALISVSNSYSVIHKFLCLFICVFGSLANGVHFCVLSHAIMRKSTVNKLLSIIAICDILTMISYLVFIIRFGFAIDQNDPPVGYQFFWIAFLLSHVVWSIALHTIELYLSVATAWIRYKTLKQVGSFWNNGNAAFPIFIFIAALVIILCIPTFVIHEIISINVADKTTGSNVTLYSIGLTEFRSFNTCYFFKLNLWLTGIMFKVIPCILLMFFTFALLYELRLNQLRRKKICSRSAKISKKTVSQSDRTTKILLSLLSVFLFTELPQGFLAILNGLWPNDIHQFVYLSLGDFLDLLSLINCNTCFIVYPLISTQYRKVSRILFWRLKNLICQKNDLMALNTVSKRRSQSPLQKDWLRISSETAQDLLGKPTTIMDSKFSMASRSSQGSKSLSVNSRWRSCRLSVKSLADGFLRPINFPSVNCRLRIPAVSYFAGTSDADPINKSGKHFSSFKETPTPSAIFQGVEQWDDFL